ncbi:MAG: hypothetical protein KatS3mg115_2477 [Candidatus Poribacteria bacterium]|nr:MAG: hypothetical protein KatS3mg115_2477 [Candidatus Poribacteria bacterium]
MGQAMSHSGTKDREGREIPMSLAFSRREGIGYFWIFGSLTHRDAADLEDSFDRVLLFTGDCLGLVLNLSHLQRVDREGLTVLNRLIRRALGPLYERKLVGVEPPEPVRAQLAQTPAYREIRWYAHAHEAAEALREDRIKGSERPNARAVKALI